MRLWQWREKEEDQLLGLVDEKKGNMPGATLKMNKKEFLASHNTSSPSPQTPKASSLGAVEEGRVPRSWHP